jgi:LDH2 family malate/lactate/ureidoglycolate dehydrogenase
MAQILIAGGADPEESETVARVLCWADERQRYPQGAVWIETFLRRLQSGALRSPAAFAAQDTSPSAAVVDARDGFGHVAATRATDLAAVKADDVGIGLVVVINSTHFGAAGHYASSLADRGKLGLVFTNAYPKVAAHGGTRATLGTNPMAFSVPVDGAAYVVGDLSTGALAGSRVREAIERGEPLPDGMALDARGRATNDPRALDEGGVMLPAAGAKGYALGLMVELFGAVLGAGALVGDIGSMFDAAAPVRVSHTIIAIRPFDAEYGRRAAQLLAHVRERNLDADVRIPGDERQRAADAAQQNGIELPEDTVQRLRRCAEDMSVELPDGLCAEE